MSFQRLKGLVFFFYLLRKLVLLFGFSFVTIPVPSYFQKEFFYFTILKCWASNLSLCVCMFVTLLALLWFCHYLILTLQPHLLPLCFHALFFSFCFVLCFHMWINERRKVPRYQYLHQNHVVYWAKGMEYWISNEKH